MQYLAESLTAKVTTMVDNNERMIENVKGERMNTSIEIQVSIMLENKTYKAGKLWFLQALQAGF